LENPDGTLKNGLDFEVLFKEYQETRRIKEQEERTSGESSHADEGDESDEMGAALTVAV
jgi:hypothetical protein